MKDFVQWTAPSPLWEAALSLPTAQTRRAELSRPSILRFATDSFMDDFLQMLESDPKKLDQYVVQYETWRGISPLPSKTKAVPAFARSLHRLGVAARRKKAKNNALAQTNNQLAETQNAAEPENPLKLYQPAHQRFYLISACLVCERPGLPDKTLNPGREEKVSFVIRRLFPNQALNVNDPLPALDSSWIEHAFVLTDQGARWKRIENSKKTSLVEGEEQLPLFSVNFTEDDGRRRKLFAGVIPAGKREAYMAATNAAPPVETRVPGELTETEVLRDSRYLLLNSIFRDPWKSLLQTVGHTKTAIAAKYTENGTEKSQPENVKNDLLKRSRDQVQAISWLILLDLADFLQTNLPKIWKALKGEAVTLNNEETKLKNAIIATAPNSTFNADINAPNASDSKFLKGSIYTKANVSATLKDALLKITGTNTKINKPYSVGLESVAISYDREKSNNQAPFNQFPDFLFPLADPEVNFNLQTNLGSGAVQITPTVFTDAVNGFNGEAFVNEFAVLVKNVLKKMPQNTLSQATPLAAETPMDMREGFYLIRCVYERPLCGPIDPPVLSEPTQPFQIAGFFDPDAPARPIRIALPIDTTPAGLRKFNKNTAFMMSDLLCGQVNRMKGITFMDLVMSVLPFPFHKDLSVPDSGGCSKDGASIGMICSLSIPIITICALILLIIIVTLLDFIFRWLPFFILCFPLPGLKGKK